jgi:hypothetical protein
LRFAQQSRRHLGNRRRRGRRAKEQSGIGQVK